MPHNGFMRSNNHVFSGAHGTIYSSCIMKNGFTILPVATGSCMFGAGIYFYANDVDGRWLAYKWAELRANELNVSPAKASVVSVDISFGDNKFFRWGEEEEKRIFTMLKEQQRNVPDTRLTRKLQNEMRERWLAYIISKMPDGCVLILTDLPLPPHTSMHGIRRYPGCVVRDVSILPPPPYKKEL